MDEFDRLPSEYGRAEIFKILRRGIDFDYIDFGSVSVQMLELMGALGFDMEVDGDRHDINFSFSGRI
jgi:hypothetical protein